jgi:hypothetical protein
MSNVLHVGVLSFWTLSSNVPQIQYRKNHASQTGTYQNESSSNNIENQLDGTTVNVLALNLLHLQVKHCEGI